MGCELAIEIPLKPLELHFDCAPTSVTVTKLLYETTLSGATVVVITHGLDTWVTPVFIDSSNTNCLVDWVYLDRNSIQCNFSPPFTGKVYM